MSQQKRPLKSFVGADLDTSSIDRASSPERRH